MLADACIERYMFVPAKAGNLNRIANPGVITCSLNEYCRPRSPVGSSMPTVADPPLLYGGLSPLVDPDTLPKSTSLYWNSMLFVPSYRIASKVTPDEEL